MNVSEIFQKFLLELILNTVLVSGVQQSESVIYIHVSIPFFFLRFFSHISHYRVLSSSLCLKVFDSDNYIIYS